MTPLTPTDLAWVMRTVDRRPKATNYLGATLARLDDVAPTTGLLPLYLVDSGSPHPTWVTETIAALNEGLPLAHLDVELITSEVRLTNNQNAIRALEVGLDTGKPWIVHLEDDLDVIDDVFTGIAAWLGDHDGSPFERFPLYTFHAPYKGVREAVTRGHDFWRYPISVFYGNQCWAVRRIEALSLVDFLRVRVPTWSSGQGFDLLIKAWATERGHTHFLASAPSFVQHLGVESSLHLGRFHQNSSWPGRAWSYKGSSNA